MSISTNAIANPIHVDSCYYACPFFRPISGYTQISTGEMYCGHPHWIGEPAYSEMIITQDNSHGRVPDECPLRHTSVIQLIQIKE
jgi:hypothetical protein